MAPPAQWHFANPNSPPRKGRAFLSDCDSPVTIAHPVPLLLTSLAMTLPRALSLSLIAIGSFAAGSLLTARLMHLSEAHAAGDRVFELRVYHTVPGKATALQNEFRDTVTKLFARHDLKALGYWAPLDAPTSDNTFVYILAHPSRDAAKEHWDAFRADPQFQEMMKAQQGDNKIVDKVDSTYMSPTDFSPTK